MTDTGLFFNWYPSSEQSRPSQPARRMVVIPPPPQHGHLHAPIQLSSQPQSQHANQVQVTAQATPAVGVVGQSNHLPGLELIESSDDEMEEDAAPDPLSPIIVEEAGPPPLVETHEEEEDVDEDEIDGGDFVVDDDADDFEMEEEEDEMIDDFQFGGDGKRLLFRCEILV